MRVVLALIWTLACSSLAAQNLREWNWKKLSVTLDTTSLALFEQRSLEWMQVFHKGLEEAENELGYKSSGSLYFQAFSNLEEYESALQTHSAYMHQNGQNIEDANDGLFPIYLHATPAQFEQQIRWGIAFSLLREYLFGITVKQRFDQAKLNRLPAWLLYGYCRHFALGWTIRDQYEWNLQVQHRSFSDINHIPGYAQDIFGQFVWNRLAEQLGRGTLSSLWFVIKYTGSVDQSFQYHLGTNFHPWLEQQLPTESSSSSSSSLFQSDFDWGKPWMNHPIAQLCLSPSLNKAVAEFQWPGKTCLGYVDESSNRKWFRTRDKISLCFDLSFDRPLIWRNHLFWESLWREDGKWVWSRWNWYGELEQRELWEFEGHPVQILTVHQELIIVEQLGAFQQASPYGKKIPSHLNNQINEIKNISPDPYSDLALLRCQDSATHQAQLWYDNRIWSQENGLGSQAKWAVSERPGFWSVMIEQDNSLHWLYVRDSANHWIPLGEQPLDGDFAMLGNTGHPDFRFVSDFKDGHARIRLYSILTGPTQLSDWSPKSSMGLANPWDSDSLENQSPSPQIRFLGTYPKPKSCASKRKSAGPDWTNFSINEARRWYYLKHAALAFSNVRSPLGMPSQVFFQSLYNATFTPQCYAQIASSDLRHRIYFKGMISPDFRRNAFELNQEFDALKNLQWGHHLNYERRRFEWKEQGYQLQASGLEVYLKQSRNSRSQFAVSGQFQQHQWASLFTQDATLKQNPNRQIQYGMGFTWNRICSDLPLFRSLDKSHFQASIHPTYSPGNRAMSFAKFDFQANHKFGTHLRWDGQWQMRYAPGSGASIQWVGGSAGWVSQEAWQPYPSSVFSNRSQWQEMGPGLRGFQSGARLGSSYAVFHQSLSSPVLQYWQKGLLRSGFSKSLLLYVFNDLGTAFFGATPRTEGNPFNTVYWQTPNYLLSVSSQRNPYLASFGMGLQARVLGLDWRLEKGWGYLERKLLPPLWQLSMGKIIDWQ